MTDLSNDYCTPCRSGVPPASSTEIDEWMSQLPNWQTISVEGVLHLSRSFKFKTFKQALNFTNRVGEIAEAEQHHPAILTEWGQVTISWWTHKINGLHHNDFIMAAKTDQLFTHG